MQKNNYNKNVTQPECIKMHQKISFIIIIIILIILVLVPLFSTIQSGIDSTEGYYKESNN